MRKNTMYNITGCLVALFAGVWARDAKADYPKPSEVRTYWRQNPELFPTVFKALFDGAENLHLLSAGLPKIFSGQERNLYTISPRLAKDVEFHTTYDLDLLAIDDCVKRICKTLGSREFLEGVLTRSIVDEDLVAVLWRDYEMSVRFSSKSFEEFFNAYGTGRLDMTISQRPRNKGTACICEFVFIFERRENDVFLTGYEASYALLPGGTAGLHHNPKPKSLPRLPFSCIKRAMTGIPQAYTEIRQLLRKGKGMPELDCCKVGFKDVVPEFVEESEGGTVETSCLPWYIFSVFEKRQFYEKIFGCEEFKMLETNIDTAFTDCFEIRLTAKPLFSSQEEKEKFQRSGIFGKHPETFLDTVGFALTSLELAIGENGENKFPDQWEVWLRLEKPCRFTRGEKLWFDTYEVDRTYWDYICFHFFLDGKKGKIRDVELRDKLYLNGELVAIGETEETKCINSDDF